MAESNEESDLRNRLAIALDVDDLVAALRIARDVRPWFGVAKIGLELFIASGPEGIGALNQLGYKVFLDLKLDDIPTTVERAARIAGSLGVGYLTLHARGGVNNLRAGVNGLADGAHKAGLPRPVALGVTVLTSDASAAARRRRAELREKLKMGSTSLKELLEEADRDEVVGKMKVVTLLESLPGVGKVRARRLMEDIGISESRRVRGLGGQQREALLKTFQQS